jgi:DNA-binding HxlR family transcriptional regulator
MPVLSAGGDRKSFICYQLCYPFPYQVRGDGMFIREKNLRSMVLRQLRDQDKSISRLSRDLEKDGARLHRLVLTGYLQALAEAGLLREKDIPPSKVYSIAGARLQDIYESVGEKLRAAEKRRDRRSRMGIFLLQRLFRRPVFLEELKRCGLAPPKRYRAVGAEERAESRRIVENAGMALPPSDPCYRVSEDFSAELYDMLSEELLERANLRPLRLETKQVKLI